MEANEFRVGDRVKHREGHPRFHAHDGRMCYSRSGVITDAPKSASGGRLCVQWDCGKSVIIEYPSELVLLHREPEAEKNLTMEFE